MNGINPTKLQEDVYVIKIVCLLLPREARDT